MLMGALLIHLTGGRLETHFHVFGSLAFLAFYRDWKVLIPATVVVALDHMLRGIFWPQSVYGVVVASQWRWLEHAAWVIFEDLFLVVACVRSISEMRQTAERTATLEHEVRTRQDAETDARNARARNDAILDVALDCVVVIDEAGKIAQFNPAAEGTFGYTAAEAVGSRFADLLGTADKARPHARRRRHAQSTARADGGSQGRRALPGGSGDCADLVRRRADVRGLHARHHRAQGSRARAGAPDATCSTRTIPSGRTPSSWPRWSKSCGSRSGRPRPPRGRRASSSPA